MHGIQINPIHFNHLDQEVTGNLMYAVYTEHERCSNFTGLVLPDGYFERAKSYEAETNLLDLYRFASDSRASRWL